MLMSHSFPLPSSHQGTCVKRSYMLVPMATTEGALVASATRGASLCNRSGGVRVTSTHQRMTRVPAFVLTSNENARAFAQYVDEHFEELNKIVRATSMHAVLTEVR